MTITLEDWYLSKDLTAYELDSLCTIFNRDSKHIVSYYHGQVLINFSRLIDSYPESVGYKNLAGDHITIVNLESIVDTKQIVAFSFLSRNRGLLKSKFMANQFISLLVTMTEMDVEFDRWKLEVIV